MSEPKPEGTYMQGAWVDTNAPMYLVRINGLGENIVRNGDVVTEVVEQRITQPAGPMWVTPERFALLTESEWLRLKKLKVEVRVIEVYTIQREGVERG